MNTTSLQSRKFLISSLILSILLIIFGIYWFVIRSKADNLNWIQEPKSAYILSEQKNKPILLAFVATNCGGEIQDNPCPSPENVSELKNFILLEVIHNSSIFIEFQYDDRFEKHLDKLPQFFLLNSAGEIRDQREIFPDANVLAHWKKIR
jgi:hypothetical protein